MGRSVVNQTDRVKIDQRKSIHAPSKTNYQKHAQGPSSIPPNLRRNDDNAYMSKISGAGAANNYSMLSSNPLDQIHDSQQFLYKQNQKAMAQLKPLNNPLMGPSSSMTPGMGPSNKALNIPLEKLNAQKKLQPLKR